MLSYSCIIKKGIAMLKKLLLIFLIPLAVKCDPLFNKGKMTVDMQVAVSAIAGVTIANILQHQEHIDQSEYYTSIIGFVAAELLLMAGHSAYNKFFKKPDIINNQIAIIELNELMSTEKYVSRLEKALCDENIVGVLLKVNSSGGAAGASEVMYRELKRIQQHKPIVAFVENTCCSGAYLASCAADKIIAPVMAELGSIGVLCAIEKIHSPRSAKKEHIDIDFVYAGKDKLIKHPYGPEMSPEQRAKMQGTIDKDYEFFCEIVSENRNIPLSSKEEWADAQTFNAQDAHKLGLCDYIGGLSEAKQLIKNLVNEKKEDATKQLDFILLN